MSRERISRPFEVKKLDESGTIAGYGSVFGVEDSYSDIVMPGAFARSLKERMPRMLWMHDVSAPIGVWTSAKEDATGLYLEGKIAIDTTLGGDAYKLLKMGALDGLSIGFNTKVAEYDDKKHIRKLMDVELWEVSPVTFPANEEARIDSVKAMSADDMASCAQKCRDLKSMCAGCNSSEQRDPMMSGMEDVIGMLSGGKSRPAGRDIRSIERALRDAGLSRTEAKAVLADGFKALRDAAPDEERSEANALRDAAAVDGDVVARLRSLAAVIHPK